jgi:maleate cis-trans isomerase
MPRGSRAGKRRVPWRDQEVLTMFGPRGRLGLIVPANNGVLEPELWSRLPPGVALYATRILAKGDLTPDTVRRMERLVDRAVDELAVTVVDVIVYADMVTTFIMGETWNEDKTKEIADRTGIPCISAWTALAAALDVLGIRRFALGTPYPRPIHALVRPFFERRGRAVTGDRTLDILKVSDVPRVTPDRVKQLVRDLERTDAQGVVLLATDLPTFEVIDAIEHETGLPVLTSNQTLLWKALRRCNVPDHLDGIGRLFRT